MDEPFVSLDEPTAERLRRLLLETLRSHPATVLFVTHNLREAITLADRIVLLSPRRPKSSSVLEVPLFARPSASTRRPSTARATTFSSATSPASA